MIFDIVEQVLIIFVKSVNEETNDSIGRRKSGSYTDTLPTCLQTPGGFALRQMHFNMYEGVLQ